MGYDSRLYVVKKSDITGCGIDSKADGMRYGEVVAMFELCGVHNEVMNRIMKYGPTDTYIYIGDEQITEDCYGKPLIEIPITDMIDILSDALVNCEYYRRYRPCLQMLKGFNLNDWNDELVVLHYGH